MSVNKRTWKDSTGKARTAWRVRWQEGETWQSRTFERKADAEKFDAEVKRRQRLGVVADLDAGTETLAAYVESIWGPTYAAVLAPRTRKGYASLYDVHLHEAFGGMAVRDITPERIGRWQADRLRGGAGPASTQKALTLLGNILQRAAEGGRISQNPVRLVRKARVPKSPEKTPLAPSSVEAIRRALLDPVPIAVAASGDGKRNRRSFVMDDPRTPETRLRDATLVSVLAYAGLRPGEAMRLTWEDVREATLLVLAPKTNTSRTVRLLAPLANDLREWKLAAGSPEQRSLVFPGMDLNNWRSRAWARAVEAAEVPEATPYTLRHSFASLLIAEGRSVIYVARQLGHGAQLTLGTYGHVIDELEGVGHIDAEEAIREARKAAHNLPIEAAA